jgi:hypothetical protein
VLFVGLAALSACGREAAAEKPKPYELVQPSLCTLVTFHDAAKALGAPPVGATDTADSGALNPGCSWMAATESLGHTPRMLVFTVWRKKALDMQGATMSGRALYEDEVGDIHEEFGAIHSLHGVGEEARIAYAVDTGGELRAKVVALKGADVLTMQLTGADRQQLETIAVKVSEKM